MNCKKCLLFIFFSVALQFSAVAQVAGAGGSADKQQLKVAQQQLIISMNDLLLTEDFKPSIVKQPKRKMRGKKDQVVGIK